MSTVEMVMNLGVVGGITDLIRHVSNVVFKRLTVSQPPQPVRPYGQLT